MDCYWADRSRIPSGTPAMTQSVISETCACLPWPMVMLYWVRVFDIFHVFHILCSINNDLFDKRWGILHPKHRHAGRRCQNSFDAVHGCCKFLVLVRRLDWCPYFCQYKWRMNSLTVYQCVQGKFSFPFLNFSLLWNTGEYCKIQPPTFQQD